MTLAKNPDRRLHRAAAEALGAIGGPEELDVLLEVLGHGDRWTTGAAMSALFAVGARTRTAVAARAIAVTSDNETAQADLVHHLLGAATLAWEAPSRPAISATLRRALQHPQEKIVERAIQVATAMRAEELIAEVVQALGHPRWSVDVGPLEPLGEDPLAAGSLESVELGPAVPRRVPRVRLAAHDPLERRRAVGPKRRVHGRSQVVEQGTSISARPV